MTRLYYKFAYLLLPVVIAGLVLAGLHLHHFAFDASSDTFVAESDEAFAYYQEVTDRFGSDSFIFATFQPREGGLFDEESLAVLADFQADLAAIDGVEGTTSILDVPLLKSPPVPVDELATGFNTLRSETVDLALAREELRDSPLYENLLISSDGTATALRLGLAEEERLGALRAERDRLQALPDKGEAEQAALRAATADYAAARRAFVADQERLLADIREVRDRYSDRATIYLTGVPMVASDMIGFVKRDVAVFGGVSLLVIVLFLMLIFGPGRWVILPVVTALLACFAVAGLLGYLRQPVTVISANFLPLLLIFSISFTVHILVRMRELARIDADRADIRDRQGEAMRDKFLPCLYTALTTMVAFASLMASGIVPVDDFGWIMCASMLVALVLNYTFLPGVLRLLPPRSITPLPARSPVLTDAMRFVSVRLPWLVILVAVGSTVAAVIGMGRLSTESQFIDYFRDRSDIKQGLVFADQNLGGTTPMDIILTVAPYQEQTIDSDDDFFDAEPDPFPQRYWYTPDKVELLRDVHAYLTAQPEVGKVISLATLEEIARDLNDGQPLNSVALATIVGAIPEDLRTEFLTPYSAPEAGMLRISVRIKETVDGQTRDELIAGIERFAVEELGLAPENVRVTGVNVLFNNMLKMLVNSQVSTIGLVILATFIMLLLLLRSPTLAIIGLVPNVLAAIFTLGLMGFLGITLDMMTITIAAIIVGIGVDNAIHYLFRFRTEKAAGRSTAGAIEASHDSIGFALYYTALTIVAGFSILGFSNFIPTVYFGLLTAAAMVMSLLANLVISPSLLMLIYRDKTVTAGQD